MSRLVNSSFSRVMPNKNSVSVSEAGKDNPDCKSKLTPTSLSLYDSRTTRGVDWFIGMLVIANNSEIKRKLEVIKIPISLSANKI